MSWLPMNLHAAPNVSISSMECFHSLRRCSLRKSQQTLLQHGLLFEQRLDAKHCERDNADAEQRVSLAAGNYCTV